MFSAAATGWLLALAVLAANAPFVNQRLLLVLALPSGHKPFWLRALEWGLLYLLVGALGMTAEHSLGQRHPQDWQFYAITLAMFATFAFPGFVYRYLLKHR